MLLIDVRSTFVAYFIEILSVARCPNTFSTGRSAYLMVRFEGWHKASRLQVC